jgi:hypothetical protein
MTTYRKKFEVTRPYGVSVTVGYSSELREYRCRLKNNGVPYEPADYFTNDGADAEATARAMANEQYRKLVSVIEHRILPDELKRLRDVAWRVWQYIGYDVLEAVQQQGEAPDNEACIESCFDADRPLTCTYDGKPNVEDQAFCKAMYQKYGFDTVVSAVSRGLNVA